MNTVLYIALVLATMSAFDTLYYHEYKLQLPKAKTAILELRLHAARDFVYSILFFSLGWIEWHGAYAMVFAALVFVEVVITQWDFIEEDCTRRLPKGERVMHSLMGIVYGILVATFAPVWWSWWNAPTGFAKMDHGIISWVLLAMSIGVFASGIRDLWSSLKMKR